MARVRALREAVAEQLAAVDAAEQRAEAFNDRVAAARDQIAAVQASAEAKAAALAATRARRQAAVDSLQSQVAGWTSEVERLERISARQAQQEVGDWFGDWAIPESIVMCESSGNWGRQPELRSRRRVPDHAVHLGALRGRGRPRGRLALGTIRYRLADLGRLGAAAWACAG